MEHSGGATPKKLNAPGALSRAFHRRRGVIIALTLCVIAGSGFWQFFSRDRPQKIVALPSANTKYLVRDGIVYRLEWEGKCLSAITTMPASVWGAKRALSLTAKNGSPVRIKAWGSIASDDHDLLILENRPPPAPKIVAPAPASVFPPSETFAAVPPNQPPYDLGKFALPALLPPPAPGDIRQSADSGLNDADKKGGAMILWRIPRSGDAVTQTTLDTAGVRPSFAEIIPATQSLYWTRYTSATGYRIYNRAGVYEAYPANGAVLQSPLTGGPPKAVGSGFALYDARVNEQAIGWLKRSVYPDLSTSFHFRRLADGPAGKEYVLTNYPVGQPGDFSAPVECGGRWYWLEPEAEESGERPAAPGPTNPNHVEPFFYRLSAYQRSTRVQVVSAAPDGASRRVVIAGQDDLRQDRRCARLIADKEKLYVLYEDKAPPPRRAQGVSTVTFIARIHPDKSPALGKPREFPYGVSPDDITIAVENGFVYFPLYENESGIRETFDFLFAEKQSESGVRYLYRMSLPE